MATKQDTQAKAEPTYTFRNRYPAQRVRVAPGRTIQFHEEGLDDEGRLQGVYRTQHAEMAELVRQAIAKGGVPAWEEDQEERDAVRVLSQRRERAAAKVAALAEAARVPQEA